MVMSTIAYGRNYLATQLETGTWVKIKPGQYSRITGETVSRTHPGWTNNRDPSRQLTWSSCWAAMDDVEAQYRALSLF